MLSNIFLLNQIFFKNSIFYTFINYWEIQYLKIILYFILAFIICGLLTIISYFSSLGKIKDYQKLSPYECGFDPYDQATRLPFEVHFYVVSILFLIFDIEIAVLFPWIFSLSPIDWTSFYMMMWFLILLTVGFIYEVLCGALTWPTRSYVF